MLAPASEFLKKGLSGKCILVCTCPNGQADSLITTHFLCSKIPRNMLTMQQISKVNGFKVIKSMRNNTCHSSICYNLFRASQNLCWASKNYELLARHGKLVLKLMLVPVTKVALIKNISS